MDLQAAAGVILIASFVFLALGATIASSGAYMGADIPSRLRAISEDRIRWKLSKVFDGLAIFSPAIAVFLLTIAVVDEQPLLPLVFGTAGFTVSGMVGIYVVYRAAVNPEAAFIRSMPWPLDIAGSVGISIGMVLIGLAYLQGTFPRGLAT